MLVVGSSLMVYSGYRLVQAMSQAGKPIAAINLGRTRADNLLSLKVAEECGAALSAVALHISGPHVTLCATSPAP
jgi:NAD-dependent SIR2 family protein deacetylase